MASALKNRDTRVQIIIVENGKYILLKHLAKKENVTFWGLPGGGREPHETDEEAAMREALEETGLIVRLLPMKHEVDIPGKKYVYNRIVTFLAYPVEGEAKTGSEPKRNRMQLIIGNSSALNGKISMMTPAWKPSRKIRLNLFENYWQEHPLKEKSVYCYMSKTATTSDFFSGK